MIKMTPVDTPNKQPGTTNDDYQQFTITTDEPVTINVILGSNGHHAFVYRGVLAEDDESTQPVGAYDGIGMSHDDNTTWEV